MEDNQSANQPTYQSANQSPNQITDQPTIPLSNPANQPLNQPVNQPTNQMSDQTADPLVNQPTDQSYKKWSDLKGLAVVAIDNGSKIGTLEDFYFDPSVSPAANSIRGFRVKTGMFSHRALPATAINAIGTDAVTIDNEDMLLHEKDEAEFATLPLGQSLLNYKVMSEGGTIIGTVGNVLLDITTPNLLRVYAFELSGGLRSRISGHYSTFYAQQVVRYGQDVLVIPDAVGSELSR
ncbi:MAG TPA: PRC-barrel domain-containing protein [Ktedonobacteraceae bacterium]|nr:PRC-barrel domain-containing protein [Ktedonobacteraceae bacterium]